MPTSSGSPSTLAASGKEFQASEADPNQETLALSQDPLLSEPRAAFTLIDTAHGLIQVWTHDDNFWFDYFLGFKACRLQQKRLSCLSGLVHKVREGVGGCDERVQHTRNGTVCITAVT